MFAKGQSVRPESRTRTDYESWSVQSWREFFPGLMAVGRGNTPGPQPDCRVSQSVKPDRSLQIYADPHRSPQTPTDAHKYRQVPTDSYRRLQAQTDPHSSPPFKQRICSPPQSLIVFRSGSEENNYSVIMTHSRRKDREDGRTVIWVTMPCLDFIYKQAW